MRLKDLSETFLDELRVPEFAAGYLQAALEENDLSTFLVALRDVVQASDGMAKTAQETALRRRASIKPSLRTETSIFDSSSRVKSVGLQFSIIAHSDG
jgi:DNA-binding phage protein